jgi:DNA polymerase I-like protein with 3'-5' exonuclease and polymerase domains
MGSMDQKFLEYSGKDSARTVQIHDAIWDALDPVFRPAYDMTMRLLPVLMFMQTRGIVVNKTALAETKVDVLASAAEKQKELDALVGRHLNVNSPKACQAYFYGELGIPPYKTATGAVTLDDLALQRLVRGTAARPGLRQAKLVQEIRGLQKLYGTYLNLEFDGDGRLRGSYNPRGTKYGRLSSSKTIFGTGTNFQNLPQEFKKFLEADPGYVFVEVDKRQAEWVVVAYVTNDANMIAAVENGVDVHTHTASLMFNVSYDIIKKEHKLNGHTTSADVVAHNRRNDPDIYGAMLTCGKQWPRAMSLRQCGKKSNHGLNYDEGPNGFAIINEIEIPEAKRIVSMYHNIYPGIRIWYETVKKLLQKDRILVNCFRRAVRFLGAWGDTLWKSAYSMLPQSTVVDSLNQGMVSLYEDEKVCGINGANADILAQVHDSILLQVPVEYLKDEERFNQLLEKIREETSPDITYNGRTFKIASDFKFGMNWGEYNQTKNPGGMQEFEDYDSFMNALDGWENLNGTRAFGLAG